MEKLPFLQAILFAVLCIFKYEIEIQLLRNIYKYEVGYLSQI